MAGTHLLRSEGGDDEDMRRASGARLGGVGAVTGVVTGVVTGAVVAFFLAFFLCFFPLAAMAISLHDPRPGSPEGVRVAMGKANMTMTMSVSSLVITEPPACFWSFRHTPVSA